MRQPRIPGRRQNHLHVLDVTFAQVEREHIEHFLLDLNRDHLTFRSDFFRQSPGEVAHSRTEVHHRGSRWDLEGADEPVWLLLAPALGSGQPVSIDPTHRWRDLPWLGGRIGVAFLSDQPLQRKQGE